MNKLGSNAPGLKLSCARFHAHFTDFFYFFLIFFFAVAPLVSMPRMHQKAAYD